MTKLALDAQVIFFLFQIQRLLAQRGVAALDKVAVLFARADTSVEPDE